MTEQSLYVGIEQVAPGETFGDVSGAIQRYVEATGSVWCADYGHGSGGKCMRSRSLPLSTPDDKVQYWILRPGMTFAHRAYGQCRYVEDAGSRGWVDRGA